MCLCYTTVSDSVARSCIIPGKLSGASFDRIIISSCSAENFVVTRQMAGILVNHRSSYTAPKLTVTHKKHKEMQQEMTAAVT